MGLMNPFTGFLFQLLDSMKACFCQKTPVVTITYAVKSASTAFQIYMRIFVFSKPLHLFSINSLTAATLGPDPRCV